MEKSIPPVKSMRDFYPPEMRTRLWFEDLWRRVSEKAGFEPWDAPIVEHLDLYRRKSGEEIVGQLYTLRDQSDRELAIRPEMTPSLARMVAQQQASLPRPIKWYTIGRMCRYERKQRGRLREFWQWNVDLLGVADVLADAEVISVALDALEGCGLGPEDIEVRLNSRKLMAAALTALGIPDEQHPAVYAVLDKQGKLPPEAVDTLYQGLPIEPIVLEQVRELVACASLTEVRNWIGQRGLAVVEPALVEVERAITHLADLGKKNFVRFDIGVVRGLAYYTGIVFEIFDRRAELRAICGGGRYDNLLETMGGQSMPAVGFGMGDVVLGELLKDLGKIPSLARSVDYQLIALEEATIPAVLQLAWRIRACGRSADYAFRTGQLGKALKSASSSGARFVVLVGGEEFTREAYKVRDMRTGEEREVPIAQFQQRLQGSW